MKHYDKIVSLINEYMQAKQQNDLSKCEQIKTEVEKIGEKLAEGGYGKMYEMQCEIYDLESSVYASVLGDLWSGIDVWRRQGY